MWASGVLKGKAKEEAQPVFSLRAARKMPGNARKKKEVGGVSEGKGGEAHLARGEGEKGKHAEALPQGGGKESEGDKGVAGACESFVLGKRKGDYSGVKVLKGGGKLRGKSGKPWKPMHAVAWLIFDGRRGGVATIFEAKALSIRIRFIRPGKCGRNWELANGW